MCQHYEHSAAESTIDLDSPPHGCRVPSENLLLLRCDERNEALTSRRRRISTSRRRKGGAVVTDSRDGRVGRPPVRQHRPTGSALRPERSIIGRISTFFRTSPECPRPDSNRQPAD